MIAHPASTPDKAASIRRVHGRRVRRGASVAAAALVMALAFAACSEDESDSSPAGDPATTTTSTPDPADPAETVEAHFDSQNEAARLEAREFFDFLAEHSYPDGSWTRDDVACFYKSRMESQLGEPLDYAEFYQRVDGWGIAVTQTVDPSTAQPDPTWVLPPPGPGTGEVPAGEIYLISSTITEEVLDPPEGIEEPAPVTRDVHVTIIDGDVYTFPIACEPPPGTVS